MRARPHSHQCSICKAKVECGGDLERNFDGFPETICNAYHNKHTGGIADVLCGECASAAELAATLDELENV